MPTNRLCLKAIALAVTLGAGGVCAQDDPWYSGLRSGWGPGGSSLGFRGSLPGEAAMGGTNPEVHSTYKQLGGYRVSDSIAIEGTQSSYGLNSPACNGDAPAGDVYRSCYGAFWSLAGVATLPFHPGLSLYGRLGLHYVQKGTPDDSSSSMTRRTLDDVGSVLGVGVSYELSRAVTFHAESERYSDFYSNTGPGSNLGLDSSVHSIGLSIKF